MTEPPAPPAKPERDPWLVIEMRHLAALATVAQEASFSGAADSLGYVQSAVSQQIAYLERIVGRRLVERSGRPRSVTLTRSGAILLDHIEQILEQLRLAKADIDVVTSRPERAVRVGVATIFGTWLPTALLASVPCCAGQDRGGRIVRASSTELLDAVAAGTLDGAFVELPIASGPFFAMELLREPVVLVAPSEPCVTASTETILERWPLIAIDDCRATRALQSRHEETGGSISTCHAVSSPASAVPFVRAGAAAAVVTRRDLPPDHDGIAVLPLEGIPPRMVGLAWHRDRDESDAVAALRAAARDAFPRP
jgi:DNA-binding transcriptional LysR family regulator